MPLSFSPDQRNQLSVPYTSFAALFLVWMSPGNAFKATWAAMRPIHGWDCSRANLINRGSLLSRVLQCVRAECGRFDGAGAWVQ